MTTQVHKIGKATACLLTGLMASVSVTALAAGPGGMPPGGAPPMGPMGGGAMGPMGSSPMRPAGAPPMGPASVPPSGSPGGSSGELRPPSGFTRSPIDMGAPPSGARLPGNGSDPSLSWPSRDAADGGDRSRGGLSDAVSMVQQHFNATAVKTDTVTEDGQLVYRIRLLSADRARVWTVSVDARTGQLR